MSIRRDLFLYNLSLSVLTSAITPLDITAITSASLMVLSLCAITNTVRPATFQIIVFIFYTRTQVGANIICYVTTYGL